MATIIMFSFLYAFIFLLCYFSVLCESKSHNFKNNHSLYPAAVCLCGLFVVQLVVAQLVPGHVQDMGLFTSWASFSDEHAVWEYYTTDLYVDYPPVYLYVLYAVGSVARWFGVAPDSGMYLAFVKFVPILFDALTTAFVFRFSRDYIGDKKALMIAFFSAVNPMNILNSTIWGQVDSVTTFMVAAMLIALYKKRYILSCSLFTILFLTKPQMIIFAPLLGFVVLFDIIAAKDSKEDFKKMMKTAILSILSMLLILLVVPLPITGGHYGLLIENYQKALGLYPYATLNAANLFGFLGGNWINLGDKIFVLSYKTWGFIFIVAISLYVGYAVFKQKEREKIFSLGAFLVIFVYMLAHSMHERYMYPAMLLLICMYVVTGQKKWMLFYGAFSLSNFILCAWVLVYNWHDKFIYYDNVAFRLLSFINLLLSGLWFYFALLRKEKVKELNKYPMKKPMVQAKRKGPAPILSLGKSGRLVRVDYLLMLALTAFYAVFGFYHLGSRNVPETGWYPERAQETVILDLGDNQDVRQLYLYAGWIDRRSTDHEVIRELTIRTSQDGESWLDEIGTFKLDSVFRWHVFPFEPVNCRYIELTCDDARFYANEVAVFGETEAERFEIAAVHAQNPTAQLMIDEQDRVTYAYSWYDGTYFDEIYHPRTAYEHIHHLYPYENTHPPLGKVIISFGIMLFGMNPFGWRFFGTLCGVLMVPLVYVMGKKMLKSTPFAFAAAFLFSFDFMHLSQTRLATIDSYTTLFVMAMYLFMFLYMEKTEQGEKGATLSLFLCGLSFGLGAATKWQGVYAGLGLAFLYFFQYGRGYVTFCAQSGKSGKAARLAYKGETMRMLIKGCLFFIVIPFVVYFLSYIPAMMTESTGLSFFFTNQGSMLNYHSNLEAPHDYGSKWWQWPLDFMPLYAYSPNRNFVPEGTAMGITSFGNPLVWWMTIPAVIWSFVQLLRKKDHLDLPLLVALTGFLSLYIPWIFVTRTAFIYHFFPCVVFVVLMIARFMMEKLQNNPEKKWLMWTYLAAVFVLFLAFYPVLTGMAVPQNYALALRFIPGWVLG